MPSQIRVSEGSAIAIGLLEGRIDAEPSTAYLMTYYAGRCSANCGFCPQAKSSQGKTELLSRISWPPFPTGTVITRIRNSVEARKIRRVCIQAINYPEVFGEVCAFVETFKTETDLPISVSCQPQNVQNMWSLVKAGVDRIGIAVDAATERLFDKVKGKAAGGPYSWQNELLLLRTAIGVFGEGKVSTHLIVGLGETEKEACALIQQCVDMGVLPALFTFTPIRGTALGSHAKPTVAVYRRIQVARHLLVHGMSRMEDMNFGPNDEIVDFGIDKDPLVQLVNSGKPFLTSGCMDCNRPFYNESPGGPIYNYPRNLTAQEIAACKKQLALE